MSSDCIIGIAYPPLLMDPLRLLLLMAVTFVWLYCAEHADRRIKLPNVPKAYSNLAVLFGGPLGWLALRFLQADLHTKDGFLRLVKKVGQHLGFKNMLKDISAAPKEISVVLCTSNGKPIDRGTLKDNNALTLARQIVDWAIDLRASDILLDPKADRVYNLRFRVDGLLREPEWIDPDLAIATINCIKILSHVDIAERRRAQDGALLAIHNGREIMLRVATAGTLYGEKIAIRVLNSADTLVELDQTGISDPQLRKLKQYITRPHGMILVCGPTGSGKTTTLYAALGELAETGRNIITVEDPIEYPISIASQTEVNPKAGITFAGQLKHILRQTPDVIMVGEIRDAETARIALQSCETGHLVFSTLHANSSLSGLLRLIDLGIEPFLVGAGLACIMSQRLVRVLCKNCCKPSGIPKRLARAAATRGIDLDKVSVASGCEECGHTGYYGRTGIVELLDISPEIGELLNNKPSLKDLKELAKAQGMIPMQHHGITKVLDGITSLSEVTRVTVS